jgi:hypothetical protein
MAHPGAAVLAGVFRDAKGARKNYLLEISCNQLINLDSDERIQGNPSFSNPQNLGFSPGNGDVPRKTQTGSTNGVAPAVEKERDCKPSKHGVVRRNAQSRHAAPAMPQRLAIARRPRPR